MVRCGVVEESSSVVVKLHVMIRHRLSQDFISLGNLNKLIEKGFGPAWKLFTL